MTVLELIVALTVVAVLTGTALFGYARMGDELRLNQAARQIMLALTVTRTRALADDVGRRLVFDQDHDCYQPQRQVDGRYEDDGVAVELPRDIDLIGCTASGAAVTFRPRGNAATFGTISVRNHSGRLRQVVVDIAGRIRVQ
jgi:type II secretory pathway pseudopilin PulG